MYSLDCSYYKAEFATLNLSKIIVGDAVTLPHPMQLNPVKLPLLPLPEASLAFPQNGQ